VPGGVHVIDDEVAAPAAPPLVLLVDDRPENLLALEGVLEPLGLDLMRAGSGEEALRAVLRAEPALIIMDVQMPGLDGFETAQHILERERTALVPIIFLTAINRELQHHVRGYDLGAVDYVSKPFDPDVLRAKVRVLVERSVLRRTVAEQAEQLALRLEERDRAQVALARQTHELARSNAELERFAGAAARALRDPLLTAVGFLDLLADESPGEHVEAARRGIERTLDVLDGLNRYATVAAEPPELEELPLADVVAEALQPRDDVLDDLGGLVGCDPLPMVRGDRWQLVQLFGEIIDNAIAFRSDNDLRVHVSVSRRGDRWVVTVRDNGIGIPPDELSRLFTVFARPWGSGNRSGAGLGLATCRRIVERHGGEMWAESGADRGAAISFSLPAA
jgi:signal transduction histidine kinase